VPQDDFQRLVRRIKDGSLRELTGHERLTEEQSARLARLLRLVAAATRLFAGDVTDAVEWLSKPVTALGGAIPFDLADTEAGEHQVETVIGQLEHGVFA
jgi:putative toxin-antitoxin system antitoxin component (TIGR02293 family)